MTDFVTIKRGVKKRLRLYTSIIKSIGKTKIFCIGRNKTGTTSLEYGLLELGIPLCDMGIAKLLVDDWIVKDFRRIIRFCKTAQAFSDQPFSLPYTFVVLDQAYPKSKFILTIRDNPDQWYRSVCNYMASRYGNNGLPSIEDLRCSDYVYNGWIAKSYPATNDVDINDLFNKDRLVQHYNDYNNSVMKYFRNRKDDLLVLNVAKSGSWEQLCNFLGVKSDRKEFPWMNKTA